MTTPCGDGRRPALDTDGCIALPNRDLKAQAPSFEPLVTPVIVTRDMAWRDPAQVETLRLELRAALASWTKSLEDADLHAYLSLYAEDFSYRGLGIADWAALRLRTMAEQGRVSIDIEDVVLLADPEHNGLYLSRFRQLTSDARGTRETTKRLYWRRDDAGDWRIVAEDNG